MNAYEWLPQPEYPRAAHVVDDFCRYIPARVLAKLYPYGSRTLSFDTQRLIVEAARWTDVRTLAASVSAGLNPHTPWRYARDRMLQRLTAAANPFNETGDGV